MLGAAHAPQAFAGIVTSQELRKAGKVGWKRAVPKRRKPMNNQFLVFDLLDGV